MIKTLAAHLDTLKVTRRSGFIFTLWVTYVSLDWAFNFANAALAAGANSMDIAAIVAAVLVPVTGLQGFVMGFYYRHGAAV